MSFSLSLSKANVHRWTWRIQQSWAQSCAEEWCNGSALTPPLKRQSAKPLSALYLEIKFMRKWLIRGASRCHRRCRRGADGRNEMTFCSSFPPTAVAAPPPAGKDRRVGGGRVTHRERDRGKGEHKKEGKRWTMADHALQLPLPHSNFFAKLCPRFSLPGVSVEAQAWPHSAAGLIQGVRRRPRCF